VIKDPDEDLVEINPTSLNHMARVFENNLFIIEKRREIS